MHCAETMAGDKPLPQAISPSAGTLYCSGQELLLRHESRATSSPRASRLMSTGRWKAGGAGYGWSATVRARDVAAPAHTDAWTRSLGCAPFPVPCGESGVPRCATGPCWASSRPPRRMGKFTGAAEKMLVLHARQVAAVLVTGRAVLPTGEIETRFEDDGEDCDSTRQSPTICGLGGPFMLWRPGFGQR